MNLEGESSYNLQVNQQMIQNYKITKLRTILTEKSTYFTEPSEQYVVWVFLNMLIELHYFHDKPYTIEYDFCMEYLWLRKT